MGDIAMVCCWSSEIRWSKSADGNCKKDSSKDTTTASDQAESRLELMSRGYRESLYLSLRPLELANLLKVASSGLREMQDGEI